jgi:hypothetical protein
MKILFIIPFLFDLTPVHVHLSFFLEIIVIIIFVDLLFCENLQTCGALFLTFVLNVKPPSLIFTKPVGDVCG